MPTATQINASRQAKQRLAANEYSKPVQKCMSILVSLLGDGKEHTSADVHKALKEGGSNKKYMFAARTAIGAEIFGGGAAGPVMYRMVGVTARKNNPQIAKSVDLLAKKVEPHTATLREKLNAACPEYDPLVAMAQIAQDLSVPLALRLEIHQTLAKYLVPQVKAADITTNDQPIALSFKWLT